MDKLDVPRNPRAGEFCVTTTRRVKAVEKALEEEKHGYHTTYIPKGEVGEVSKVEEELNELKDALSQGNRIMALIELSDMYGAMESFLEQHYPDTSMEDVRIMSDATRRAFKNGHR